MGVSVRVSGKISNSGTIYGGHGGSSKFYGSYPGAGGVGLDLTSGTLDNRGLIHGGAGGISPDDGYGYIGGVGGAGVIVRSMSNVTNDGTITGGFTPGSSPNLGGPGIELLAGGTLVNTGLITSSGYYGIRLLQGGDVVNSGSIVGGVDALGGGTSTNSGIIVGATSGYGFGAGLNLSGAATFTNAGMVAGGNGTNGSYFNIYLPANGGTGAALAAGAVFINHGLVTGGVGGNSAYYASYGGIGISVGFGASLQNSGTVQGGTSGVSSNYNTSYNGSAGVYVNGGLVTTSGTITGGLPAAGTTGGIRGDAVQFGTLAGTLVIDPGAVFNGLVVADAAAADTLVLAASFTSGTLSGVGTEYTGFSAIDEATGAHWTLAGSDTLAIGETLTFAGSLNVAGTLSGGLATFASGHHETLAIGSHASVTTTLSGFATGDTIDIAKIATSLTFIGGTLTLYEGQSAIETLALAGSYTQTEFHLAADAHGGTAITLGNPVSSADLSGFVFPASQQASHGAGVPYTGAAAYHFPGDERELLGIFAFGRHAA